MCLMNSMPHCAQTQTTQDAANHYQGHDRNKNFQYPLVDLGVHSQMRRV